MVNKLRYVLLFCFVCTVAFAQQLKGRVVSGRVGVGNAFVINKVTGIETKTDAGGTFSIAAKPDDVLVVYNTKIMVREFMLNADSFKNMPYVVSVNYKVAELDEVVITKYGNVNTVSLGMVPANQKRYTVAERRLYTAGYGSIGLVALINVISGRMKMLKRAYATEKQEVIFEGIKDMYDEEDINEQFNIPKEQVKGFMYYLVENSELIVAVKAKNKTYADFLMLGLSKKYLELQQEGRQ
ncbi:hypothetical protein ACX0HA_08365 [Flavobacterium hauense]